VAVNVSALLEQDSPPIPRWPSSAKTTSGSIPGVALVIRLAKFWDAYTVPSSATATLSGETRPSTTVSGSAAVAAGARAVATSASAARATGIRGCDAFASSIGD
jgi:hypothetical protein